MKFDVLTLFPDIINNYCSYSIIKRAIEKNLIEVNAINFRNYTHDKHKRVDDTPYGGTSGMVLMAPPIFEAYEDIKKEDDFEFIMLTPQGQKFDHKLSVELSKKKQLILLCGRYEGFDERIRTGLKPKEISLGDFILTGGELGALCIIDSVSRQIEGVLNKTESSLNDSFSDDLNGLLEHPQYTKPREYRGMKVPEVLLNGNHQEIEKYKSEQRILRTKTRRPDLLN